MIMKHKAIKVKYYKYKSQLGLQRKTFRRHHGDGYKSIYRFLVLPD